ncbi:RluA family pseudouridine synthase [Aquibacillus albus]|uniref:Pseudouridine synthase n=1 Tax=Aquibacillus albus TaxID=1168171 RepID=A0ABS2MV17_9BACI|nr:RluA family pseudouridine synthase [Aquibacillus albus]MBM7569732.1 23S rRNA pseudouridine1911/1915/1917 synthase [Aquibacillus albus]
MITNNKYAYTVKNPTELLPFLLDKLNKGRNATKSVLARGQVSVNGQTVTAYNYPLQPGHTVTVLKNKVAKQRTFNGLTIVYEDKEILVIDKESGLLSIADDKEKQLTAYRQLTAYVREVNKNRNSRIFVVHRLDRDTSGLMMFAKTEKTKRTLQNDWKHMVTKRTYVALVEGKVTSPSGKVSSWLKESSTNIMYSSPKPNGGQHAVTHYNRKKFNQSFSLMELQLETGRKNQIRVHMADIGHPVVGDKKYGSTMNPVGRLCLHAKVLAFKHPVTGKVLRFESSTPKEFSFKFN